VKAVVNEVRRVDLCGNFGPAPIENLVEYTERNCAIPVLKSLYCCGRCGGGLRGGSGLGRDDRRTC